MLDLSQRPANLNQKYTEFHWRQNLKDLLKDVKTDPDNPPHGNHQFYADYYKTDSTELADFIKTVTNIAKTTPYLNLELRQTKIPHTNQTLVEVFDHSCNSPTVAVYGTTLNGLYELVIHTFNCEIDNKNNVLINQNLIDPDIIQVDDPSLKAELYPKLINLVNQLLTKQVSRLLKSSYNDRDRADQPFVLSHWTNFDTRKLIKDIFPVENVDPDVYNDLTLSDVEYLQQFLPTK